MRNEQQNRRGFLNTSNPDWNENGTYAPGNQNQGHQDDTNRSNVDSNVGYGTASGDRYKNYGPDRNYNERGGSSENQFSPDSGFNRGRYRDEGYDNYRDWRSSYGSDYLNYGSERGGNDRPRDEYRRSMYAARDYKGSGRGFGGGNYGSDYNGDRRGYGREERGWWDKTSDEVSSWFGNEEAERRRAWDKQRSGQHKGKGPKGYNRSDERIKEDLNDRLSDDVFIDATEIEVTVNKGEVTLIGTVRERFEKRRAEDIAEEVSGVRQVENRIRISSPSSPQSAGQNNTPSSDLSREGVEGSDRGQ